MSILKIREVHRIPVSVMNDIISSNQLLFSFALRLIRDNICTELTASGVANSIIGLVARHFDDTAPFVDIYRGLGTQHQQDNFLEQSLGLVVSCIFMHINE